MKPRLRQRWGIWACSFIETTGYPFPCMPIGYGHTPREAFLEWRHLLSLHGVAAA